MNAVRNLVHGGVLGGWAAVGLLFSAKMLFAGGQTPFLTVLLSVVTYWLWLCGLAAVSTWLVRSIRSGVGAALIHAGLFVFLLALPKAFPVNLLRAGIDLLGRA